MDLRLLPLVTLLILQPAVAVERHFASDWSNASWTVESSKLMCQLRHEIPQYGVAEFRQVHAEPLRFILHRFSGEREPGIASVVAKDPHWKRDHGVRFLGKTRLHYGREVIKSTRALAEAMIDQLDSGQLTRIQYEQQPARLVKVDLTSINFQKAYTEFTECQGKLLGFVQKLVKDSQMYFGSNSHELSESSVAQLDRIVEYIKANPNVRRVVVTGYSDNSGRRGYNNWLSELRAKSVRDYILFKGVAPYKLRVTWLGGKEPQADNQSEVGRALNRRVRIKLYTY